jgi:dipeptidyl-peptidase-4
MKRFHLLVVSILALASAVSAQDKLLSIDDIFSSDPKVRVNFNGVPSQFAWTADGKALRQIVSGKLMRVDAISGESRDYVDAKRLAAALETGGIAPADAARVAASAGLQFSPDEKSILISQQNDLWLYDVGAGTLRRVTSSSDEELEADFSPDGKFISFVRGNNLFVYDLAKNDEKQLTRDGGEKVYNGYLDWVYEEELYGRGQKRAYWWSPDSKFIAFLRLDESPVPKFVLPNDIPTDQSVETTNYPQAGDPNPFVTLGVADVAKNSLIPNAARIPQIGKKLPAGIQRLGDTVHFADVSKYKPEDLLIARVAWSPNSQTIVFQAQNREQTFLDVNTAGIDGTVKQLFREASPAWVAINDNPVFLKDGSFVFQSERDGWAHLYHFGADGQLIKRLTEGKWEVRTLHGVDEANGWVYFSGTKDSPIAESIYRVKLTGGDVQRLTTFRGNHAASFNATMTHFIDAWSDVNTPTQARLFRADGTLERVLNENRVAALDNYKLGRPEFLKVKTRDGFEMEAMMIKPPDFNPNKKYPVISYTYSGPHAQSVVDRWGSSRYMWHQMMAQKGYIIWICDNRSASGKGLESTWKVYKNFGPLELQDLEDGFSYLKSLPYVDGDRIGMWGWSYGGFMTSYAMTHSKAFKVGIAGGSVTDWRLYDSIYTERYMLTPQHNAEGYDRTSVQKAAANLSGKLLLIHGVIDDNVHMQNTMQLAYEFQKAGKQFDLMVYPTARHGLSNPLQIKHWYSMMTDYFMKNL